MMNINRNVTDIYYRYKMPKVIGKVEGRGNGIKTVITNLSEIAKSLKRSDMYVLKYLGNELGTQVNADAKSERFIINGSHPEAKIQDMLFGFIEKYVLCPKCQNPETNLYVMTKKQLIAMKCIACGNRCPITINDKTSTYILKNPPENNESGKKQTEKVAVVVDEGKNKEAEIINNLELFEKYLVENFDEANLQSSFKKAYEQMEQLNISDYGVVSLMIHLIKPDETILSKLKEYSQYLKSYATQNISCQTYFIDAICLIITFNETFLLDKTANLFKALLDFEIVEDTVFLSWFNKKRSHFVRSKQLVVIKPKCQKFIDWLGDDSESEDEDEQEESESDDDGSQGEQSEEQLEDSGANDTEDDINIDDI